MRLDHIEQEALRLEQAVRPCLVPTGKVRTENIAELLALAPRLVPRLADATVSGAWAGLRPGTPDGLPLLGRPPGWSGIVLAAGHFREGILLTPITGELVLDLLARRRPRLALDAFDPGRFRVRAA